MKEEKNNEFKGFDDEINFQELFNILWQEKWIIIFLTSVISIIGVIYSLSLPNIYQSKALLAPVNKVNGINGALQNYNGLAGLAGIRLPSSGIDDNSEKAIKKISSLSFFEENILSNIHLPDLMAVKSWNAQTNAIIFDESKYSDETKTWIREYSYPQKQIPSAQESFEVFRSKHLNLFEDKKSGFVTLSIKHQSPYIAKQWVELVVNQINSVYRQKDKAESEKAVSYLNQQILMTSLAEIKLVLAQLLQEETKKLSLIEANEYYVFDYIDPPAAMERKLEPKRAYICILTSLFGGMLSIFLVLIRHYFFNKKNHEF